MNSSIQNYGITNYSSPKSKISFTAHASESLKKELLKELKHGVGEKYLSRLTRRLEKVPGDFTVEDILLTNGDSSFVRLRHKGVSAVFELYSGTKSKLDVVEGLLEKDKTTKSTLLSNYAYRLFGI